MVASAVEAKSTYPLPDLQVSQADTDVARHGHGSSGRRPSQAASYFVHMRTVANKWVRFRGVLVHQRQYEGVVSELRRMEAEEEERRQALLRAQARREERAREERERTEMEEEDLLLQHRRRQQQQQAEEALSPEEALSSKEEAVGSAEEMGRKQLQVA